MAKERKQPEKPAIPEPKVRKRVEKEVVPDVKPKTRGEGEAPKPLINEDGISTELLKVSDNKPKPKRAEIKYERSKMGACMEERRLVSDNIAKGLWKFSHFAIDGDDSYFYYEVIKK